MAHVTHAQLQHALEQNNLGIATFLVQFIPNEEKPRILRKLEIQKEAARISGKPYMGGALQMIESVITASLEETHLTPNDPVPPST